MQGRTMADKPYRLRRVLVRCDPPMVLKRPDAYHVVHSYHAWDCWAVGPDAQPWQTTRARAPDTALRNLLKKIERVRHIEAMDALLSAAEKERNAARKRARAGLKSNSTD